MHPMLGAPLQVPVLGAGATDRTAIFRAHPPSGRERRPRKLHIPRSGASAAAHSFRCSSFSHATRFAGLAREPSATNGAPQQSPKQKKSPLHIKSKHRSLQLRNHKERLYIYYYITSSMDEKQSLLWEKVPFTTPVSWKSLPDTPCGES